MLAKIKVVEEQSDLLANSKKLMLEEQKRFVEWERSLGEREKALTSREGSEDYRAERPVRAPAQPEPVFEDAKPEEILEEDNAAKMEANVEDDSPQMRSIPAPMEQPEEMPAEAPAEEEELKPEEPAEEERKGVRMPQLRHHHRSSGSERCWACEAKLRDGKMIEAPKKKESHRPEPKPIEEPVEEEKRAEEPEEKAAHKEPDEVHKEPEEEKRSEVKRSVSDPQDHKEEVTGPFLPLFYFDSRPDNHNVHFRSGR